MRRGLALALGGVAVAAVAAVLMWPAGNDRAPGATTGTVTVVATAPSGPTPAAPVSPPPAATEEALFTAALDPAVAASSLIGVPEASAMHAKLMAERRDAVWAPDAEATLRKTLSGEPAANGGSAMARCGSTICEVQMRARQIVGDDMMAGKTAVDAFTTRFERLQGSRSGFTSGAQMHVVFAEDAPGEVGVIAYFERASTS